MSAWGVIVDPARASWVISAEGSDFPLHHLPFGIFSHPGEAPRAGVAIGDRILDLAELARAGEFADVLDRPIACFEGDTLNTFLAAGRQAWSAVRETLVRNLSDDAAPAVRARYSAALCPSYGAVLHLPFAAGDYVDFYSSIEHATNLGRIFRPTGEALLPNYRTLPVGYHGRAGSLVASGTPVQRPCGQFVPAAAVAPRFAPTEALDFELEIGCVTGGPSRRDMPLATGDAHQYIFGLLLVNDWSARDIQAWEYQPLGPMLGKSFATSVGGWIATLDALEPYRVAGPAQEPVPAAHLRSGDFAFDIGLSVALESAVMRAHSLPPVTVSRTNFRGMYWNVAQQLAHLTSNGATIRPGDLLASGTISGSTPGSYGSLIELTWNGAQPLELPSGERRAFLEDGDTVILRGRAGGDGRPAIGFGEVRGTVVAAR